MQQRLAKSLTVNGLTIPELLASKRALYGAARMDTTPDGGGGDGGAGGGSGGAGGQGGSGGEPKQVTLSQAEYDRQMSERADRAGRAARKKVLEDLGLGEDAKPEDVKQRLADAETARLASLNETERLKEETRLAKERATQLEKDRDDDRKRDAAERHTLRLDGLLKDAGVGVGEDFDKDPAKRTEALATAAKYVGLEVEVGADSDDIRKAVEKVKTTAPGLFGKATAGGGAGPGDGRPGSTPPPKRTGGQSAKEAGHELAVKLGWTKPAEKAS